MSVFRNLSNTNFIKDWCFKHLLTPYIYLKFSIYGFFYGVDSSYYIQTNMSVRRVLFEASVHIVYIRERDTFSLVCTSKKAINFFEVKVNVRTDKYIFACLIQPLSYKLWVKKC